MQLLINTDLDRGIYSVDISLAPNGFTPVELEAIQKFGEPLITCGGTFSQEGLTYTLPTNDKYFPSQFPVKQRFSLSDFEDAYTRAILWKDTVKTAISNAVINKRGMTVELVGEEIVNIDTRDL